MAMRRALVAALAMVAGLALVASSGASASRAQAQEGGRFHLLRLHLSRRGRRGPAEGACHHLGCHLRHRRRDAPGRRTRLLRHHRGLAGNEGRVRRGGRPGDLPAPGRRDRRGIARRPDAGVDARHAAPRSLAGSQRHLRDLHRRTACRPGPRSDALVGRVGDPDRAGGRHHPPRRGVRDLLRRADPGLPRLCFRGRRSSSPPTRWSTATTSSSCGSGRARQRSTRRAAATNPLGPVRLIANGSLERIRDCAARDREDDLPVRRTERR